MSTIKPCACGSTPAMMWHILDDPDIYFFHMQCKTCGRRGRSSRDVNIAVDDWNEKNGGSNASQSQRDY